MASDHLRNQSFSYNQNEPWHPYIQVYLQGSTWNFALISTGTALVVLSLDWLFFYYMPGYSWALSRWLTFVLPSAMMTLVPSLMLFSLVRHIYSAFKIDNGVV